MHSQNGWATEGRGCIASFPIPGGLIPVRRGDVATVLTWCAQQWHLTVEPLKWPGCWGYADRNVRGSATVISNHASGTAIDLNAPAHPRGVPASKTMTPAQIAAVRAIVAATSGVVRWGGDYRPPSQPDAMHLEINAGSREVAALAARIRAGQVRGSQSTTRVSAAPPPLPQLEDELMASIPLRLDAARTFHEAVGVEVGGGSQVAARGFVTFGSTYGGTTWTVAAIGADGRVLGYWKEVRTGNNTQRAEELPPGTRTVTVEGQSDNEGTRPWASTWNIR